VEPHEGDYLRHLRLNGRIILNLLLKARAARLWN